MGSFLFYAGLLLSVLAGVFSAVGEHPATQTVPFSYVPNLVAWILVGGSGMLVGLFNLAIREFSTSFLILIGLVVALTAILLQPFNPALLTNTVFWLRVFAAHILLVLSAFYLIRRFGDSQ